MPFSRTRKVLEIEGAIFRDQESFEKEMIFYSGYEKIVDFCLGKLHNIMRGI